MDHVVNFACVLSNQVVVYIANFEGKHLNFFLTRTSQKLNVTHKQASDDQVDIGNQYCCCWKRTNSSNGQVKTPTAIWTFDGLIWLFK